MAERNLHELPTKVAGRRKDLADLKKKIHLQLEADLIKLLYHSAYCDLELIVDSESLFSHSCILKTRARRFYTFITTECCVTKTSVVTTIVLENVSILFIKTFLESIYSSAFLPEAETHVIKYLETTKQPAVATNKEHRHLKSNPRLLSPDSEAFFTPKSSPSELYKPFTLLTTSQEEVNKSRSKNNASVLSYYRIVSVEDFQNDNNRDLDTALEKELAEQDELFKSLTTISTKKKIVGKPITLPLSRAGRTKEPIKRLPHWRPKPCELDAPLKTRFQKKCAPAMWFGSSSPEMDLSSTTPDSGLDLSSAAAMDSSTHELLVASSNSALQIVEPGEDSDTNLPQKRNGVDGSVHLKDDDLARLDAMEKNMKECEMFLAKEKEAASRSKESAENKLFIIEENSTVEVKTESPLSPIVSKCESLCFPPSSTPPSSPKVEVSTVPESTDNYKPAASSNFFIDASSLVDEDEISSPPMSLAPSEGLETRVGEIDPALERRQAQLIFKTSIPHFSRHEVEQPLCLVGSFQADLEPEQVVPIGDGLGDVHEYYEHSRSLPVESIRFQLPTPEFNEINDNIIEPISLSRVSNVPELGRPLATKAVDVPLRKISVECMPIVSGGASPKDFAMSSQTSSPHLPRRHEYAPIISGGMDLPEEPKPVRKHEPTGDVWVVDVGPLKTPGKRLFRGTSSESESDSKQQQSESPKEPDEKQKSFPLENSASFGYFIEFENNVEPERAPLKPKKHKNDSSRLKKNIFSMFIDIKDEPKAKGAGNSGSLTPKHITDAHDSDGTESNSGSVCSQSTSKKPLYMFIEAESPVVKRKTSPPVVNAQKPFQKRPFQSSKLLNEKIEMNDDISLTSLESVDPCSGRQSMERDVWNWDNTDYNTQLSEDHHHPISCKDNNAESKTNEVIFKKDSTFIIDGSSDKEKIGLINLHTVIEATPPKSPVKSPKPEERDSGVIVTEESDDSFVRLSDMDNTGKNPYMEPNRRKQEVQKGIGVEQKKRQGSRTLQSSSRMSQSIPEATWQHRKPSRIPEREKVMSRSIGGAVPAASSARVSKSLSRLFPNLSASTLSLARTYTSDVSEPSSMLSSIDPYGLEISTSETDVSCHADGAARLGQDLLRMFLDEISPDVVVEVGGRRMKAHKCILSSRCQYFAAMLSGGWVESAGNVISLQGFSYAAVHFALCHIYSGESEIPDSLNIVELATLADMLCLEGLKEVISYTLKLKYCHSFHMPCAACIVGVLDCLPVAADYGLDDLYRKSLRWTAKFFVKVWPTKAFSNLRKELMDKCLQYHVVHMTTENVLETILNIDQIRGSLSSIRWAETVTKALNKLQDAATKFLADHYSYVLTSDHFLALGKDEEWSIDRLERSLIAATGKLSPEQACWSHARLHSLLTLATSPDPPEDMHWNESFMMLLSTLSEYVQTSLIKQAPRAARSKAWQQMEPELRTVIQEAACLPPEVAHPPRRTTSKPSSVSTASSVRSSTRAAELRQVKLAMTQQATRTGTVVRRQQQASEQRLSLEPYKKVIPPVRRIEVRKSQSTSAVRESMKPVKGPPPRLTEVKSRYLQPRSPHKFVPETAVNTRRNNNGVSSSDSSRNCSPAMARAANAKAARAKQKPAAPHSASTRPFSQLTADDNMSTDSLATESSFGEKEALSRKQKRGKENLVEMKRPVDKIVQSLPRKTQSLSSFPSAAKQGTKPKTMIPRMEDAKRVPNKFSPRSATNAVAGNRSVMSPQLSARLPQRTTKAYANVVNGNIDSKPTSVDGENNATNAAFRPPAIVSRSGTFLKDEPTILKKPQADHV